MKTLSMKRIGYIVAGIFLLLLLSAVNPFVINNSGYRTHVQTLTGNEWVRFEPGYFWAGFFSKTTEYPDVITVVFTDESVKSEITSKNPPIQVRFNDATKAIARSTVRWRLPGTQTEMIRIHKEYRSAKKLAETTLTTYTDECLRYAAQLMESETHYSGGMSKLSEDFQDQLENGQYVLELKTEYVFDTVTRDQKKFTERYPRQDAEGNIIRNKSDVQQFNITVAYASIGEVDYEEQVDKKLGQKIEASTQESISKQKLITAQQEALTAKAEGERVIAETRAREEAAKIEATIRAEKEKDVAKIERDKAQFEKERDILQGQGEAEKKRLVMQADGALDKKLQAWINVNQRYAEAIQNYQGDWVPQVNMAGGGGQNAGAGSSVDLINLLMAKTAKDLALDLQVKEK
ncbi:MAG: SPFH domain-containing protein [Bacteroidota bacterium]